MDTVGLLALEACAHETSEHCRPGHCRSASTGGLRLRLVNSADLGTVNLEALEACALRLANSADLGTVGLEALEACALRLATTADLAL
jgi:hypothetical protein